MIVIFVAIGYGIPLHTTAEFGNCHKMISLRPPDFLPVKFRKTEMAPNFHDFAAVKMLRSLPPFSIMDAPRTHPIPRLGEMGMFHVCGKNPSRDIIFQLICFRNLRRFIRTIPGMPWIEIRTGPGGTEPLSLSIILTFLKLTLVGYSVSFRTAEAPITAVNPSGRLSVAVPPFLCSALISDGITTFSVVFTFLPSLVIA